MAHEVFEALARAAGAYSRWRPAESEWDAARSIAQQRSELLKSLRDAHSSALAPAHHHGMYGDFRQWPIYSAMAAGIHLPDDSTWTLVLALVVWPNLASSILGCRVTLPSQRHRDVLTAWLREAVKRPELLLYVKELVREEPARGPVTSARPPALTKHQDSVYRAITAYLEAYDATVVDLDEFGGCTVDEEAVTPTHDSGIVKIIDDSVTRDPANEALAPEDSGAVRYVSRDSNEDSDDGGDVVSRHHVRFRASARQHNHLPLHWDSLAPWERDAFGRAIAARIDLDDQQTGAFGLSLCALLAMSPPAIARLSIAPTFAAAMADIDRLGACLAWAGDALVALEKIPPPPAAWKPGDVPVELAPHFDFVVRGIPTEVSSLLASRGGRQGGCVLLYFPDLAITSRSIADELRKSVGSRFHIGRIQRLVADSIIAITADECIAAQVCPGARVPIGGGIYYSAIPALRAYEEHRRAAAQVLPWSPPECPLEVFEALACKWIGSCLVIPVERIQGAFKALHARAERARFTGRRTIEAVATAFNLQTIYVAATLFLTTAHRPTHAPFPHPRDINLDSEAALLAEKRVNLRTTHRIVPLTSSCIEQLTAYEQTIDAVAAFMDSSHPDIAGALRSLRDYSPQHPSAAALSVLVHEASTWMLRPLEPADWRIFWPEWVWPTNGLRHFVVQWLQRQCVRREAISYLGGHAEPGQTPFGPDCAVAPKHFFDEVRPRLETIQRIVGCPLLPPLKKHTTASNPAAPVRLPHPSFGDAATARNLNRRLSGEELASIRRILKDASVVEASADAEQEAAAIALAGGEFGQCEVTRSNVIALLKRWFRLRRTRPVSEARSERRHLVWAAQSTPIARFELRDAAVGAQLRDHIVREITRFLEDEVGRASAPAALWLSHIYLSAVAFGGALQKTFDAFLVDSFNGGVFHDRGMVWIEWRHREQLHRWVADPITAALVARFFSERSDPDVPTVTALRTQIDHLLRQSPSLADENVVGVKARRRRFHQAISAAHRTRTPGPLMAHMMGTRRSAPVPRGTWLRASGVRLVVPELVPGKAPQQTGLVLSSTWSQQIKADDVLASLRNAIARAQGSSTRGGKASGPKGDRLSELKNALREIETSHAAMNPIHRVVLARLRALADDGGRIKEVLATSTISAYMAPVLKFAKLPLAGEFLSADPELIQEAYRKIVMTGAVSKAHERLATLEDFHQIAVTEFGADPLDWGDIGADLPQVVKRVDANLIFPHELALADRLIAESVELPTHLILMAQVALHLMHDLGFRFGEVFRLRLKDIEFGLAGIAVRNTEHGETKSASGIRLVPSGILLSARAHVLLEALVDRAEEIGNKEPLTPLFCDERDPRALVLRADVARILSLVLQVATGDPSVRPHHLRHTAVTTTYDRIVIGPPGESVWTDELDLRQALLMELGLTRRATHAHAQLFGHGGPDTTASSYLHNQELRVAAWMASQLPSLSSRSIAALTGLKDATVRTKLARGNDPQRVLIEATTKMLSGEASVAAWRDLESTQQLPGHQLRVTVASESFSLHRLDRFLRLHYSMGLPVEALARLVDTTPAFATTLQRQSERSVLDTGFAPGYIDPTPFLPWHGYAVRSLSGRRVPPHLGTLPQVAVMDGVSPSMGNYWAARAAIKAFNPAQSCWSVSNASDQLWIGQWLATIGVLPTDVDIEMPSCEREVPDTQRALAGPMSTAHFTAKPPNPTRMRGDEVVTTRLQATSTRLTAATLMHATFLWITRALVTNPELRCFSMDKTSALPTPNMDVEKC